MVKLSIKMMKEKEDTFCIIQSESIPLLATMQCEVSCNNCEKPYEYPMLLETDIWEDTKKFQK